MRGGKHRDSRTENERVVFQSFVSKIVSLHQNFLGVTFAVS